MVEFWILSHLVKNYLYKDKLSCQKTLDDNLKIYIYHLDNVQGTEAFCVLILAAPNYWLGDFIIKINIIMSKDDYDVI